MKIKKYMFSLLLLLPLFLQATTFEADYDGDGINDLISEESYLDQVMITMTLSSVNNEKLEYLLDKYDEQMSPYSHKSFEPGVIEIDSSYSSQGGEIYSQLYKWDINKKKWYLIKVISGEKENYSDMVYTPVLDITRIKCCYYLGDNSFKYDEMNKSDVETDILKELNELKLLVNSNDHTKIMKRVNIYSATEYKNYLNAENLELINTIANLIRESDWQASAIILKKIIEKYPDRSESILNLADAYWVSQEPMIQKEAIFLYKKYKSLKQQEEPNYIFERIKSVQQAE